MAKTNPPTTAAERIVALNRANPKMSNAEIGRRVGCSGSYVSQVLREDSHSEWTKERIDALKAAWADGLTATEIARRLGGVTRSAVLGKAYRLDLVGRSAGRPREDDSEIKREIIDPKHADRLLRRFSWESQP